MSGTALASMRCTEPGCMRFFASDEARSEHVREWHGHEPDDEEETMSFTCPDCGATVGSERGLKTHRGRLHKPEGAAATAPKAKPVTNGHRSGTVTLTAEEASLVQTLLAGRELQGRTIAELTGDDLAAVSLMAKLGAA